MGYLMSITKYFGFNTTLQNYEDDLNKFINWIKNPDDVKKGTQIKGIRYQKPQDS